ncbi:MAG: DUF3078 domain-containing protein [Bacteroidota bacterium]|nr:DUF3078 domain-containing protein [Bacteroidota bacterium]
MKRKKCYSFLSLVCMICGFTIGTKSFAQDIKNLQADATKEIKKQKIDSGKVWKTGGQFDVNLAQGSQSNWAAGGDDFSFSINSYLGFFAFYKKEKYSWDNTLDLNYGFLNTTTLGSRKNDDRIDLLSKVGYELAPKLSLAALLNFHSQFSKGYNYHSDGTKDLLSDFLAPGYVLLSLGLDYKPSNGLSIFVSPITSRWIIVNNDTLSAKGAYGVVPGKKIKNEFGAFASVNYLHNLSKTIRYKGRLDLFSDYGHNPQNIKVYMNNMFTAKLSKVLAASFL